VKPAGAYLASTRILVVDDGRDSLDLLAYLLAEEGAIVETAASGKAALHLAITSDKFDLVISDIAMPGMDGFEFLRTFRMENRYRDTPVIALTGFGREEDIHRTEQAGFAAQLTKPIDFDDLIRVVQLALGK
jgi:two-component system CheB/CheR fusion protein